MPNSRHREQYNVTGSGRWTTACTLIFALIGLAGFAYAGLADLQFVCNMCFMGPGDNQQVCGLPDTCDPGEICISGARDFNSDGMVDQVTNVCILDPHS